MWIGFSVADFAVEDGDPHITLAYFPKVESADFSGRPVDGYPFYQNAEALCQKFHLFFPNRFFVQPLAYDLFANGHAEVLKVELPTHIDEGVKMLRQGLFDSGARFATDYPFIPHITTRWVGLEDYKAPAIPLRGLLVTSIFVDFKDQRRVFKFE